ncbi:MAG: hypothetical protein HC895_12380 [Leptolyngbyaceae cyanobacterium SM1_3_5]|nr:hypothetical protein [Leptolyngbyaceae cyanobacterium SM1_3_5]
MICSEILLSVRPEPLPLKLLPAMAEEPEAIASEIAPYHPPNIDPGKLAQLHEVSAIATETIAPYHPPNIDSGKLARLNSTRLLAVVERMAAPIDRFVPDRRRRISTPSCEPLLSIRLTTAKPLASRSCRV